MRNMKKLILSTLLLFVYGSSLSFAQVSSAEPTLLRGSDCESNLVVLDNLIIESERVGERIFVTARLGKGETSRYLTHRRLYNARTYIVPRLKTGSVVFAEGDRVSGKGRIEFHLGSKLTLIVSVKRGGDLCVCCCEACEDYYGWGKKDSVRRRRALS